MWSPRPHLADDTPAPPRRHPGRSPQLLRCHHQPPPTPPSAPRTAGVRDRRRNHARPAAGRDRSTPPPSARSSIPATPHPNRATPPRRALADFVRCRDLTCRWPGCDQPADGCDLDHTIPYPVGPTHASNIKCYCRFHHLLKTFCTGAGGWQDRQLPDGTLILTAPTGHTYTTHPGSKLLFPTLCQPTASCHHPDHADRQPAATAA